MSARAPEPILDLLPALRAASRALTPGERAGPVLVGVSGGPDSLALLHCLWRWSREGGPAVCAVHIDHGLRPESATEAGRVAAICAGWGVPTIVLRADAGAVADRREGVEEAARRERYRLFALAARQIGAPVLALGHQADDQAETVLLHLLRGAGLAGLTALPVARRVGDLLDAYPWPGRGRPVVWRPLLAVRREAIEAYCRTRGLDPSRDASNDDTALRRNAIRHAILPELERVFPGVAGNLARGAALLADDELALHLATDAAWARCAREDGDLILFERAAFGAEVPALQRRLLRRAWQASSGAAAITGVGAAAIEAAREGLIGGRTGSRFALPGGVALQIGRKTGACAPARHLEDRLRRRVALPQVAPNWRASLPEEVALGDAWTVRLGSGRAAVRSLHIPRAWAGLTFRTWQPGDRVALTSGGTRKLQDWFVDRGVPGYLRRHLPLLADGERILWVAGLAAFAPAQVGEDGVLILRGRGLRLSLHYNGAAVACTGRWPRAGTHDWV